MNCGMHRPNITFDFNKQVKQRAVSLVINQNNDRIPNPTFYHYLFNLYSFRHSVKYASYKLIGFSFSPAIDIFGDFDILPL